MRAIVAASLVLALATAASVPTTPVWKNGYHADVGMPLAARIRLEESSGLQQSRIIGGQPAPLGAHPYLVGVVITFSELGQSVCGSSLLSTTRALTAAHCWADGWKQADLFTMVMGSQYVFSGGLRVDTDDVNMHPGWTPSVTGSVANDIAVVGFPAVEFTDLIQPVALPSGSLLLEDFTGTRATAIGYGMIGEGISLVPEQVQSRVEVTVISNAECAQIFGPFVQDTTLCTSGAGTVGVCSSDSGGPLSIERDGERVLIGVVSFGSGRCEGGFPSGFARVTSYMPWIVDLL